MNHKYMITTLLIIGTICFVFAFLLYQKQSKNIETPLTENIPNDENTQKGKDFEESILDLFLQEPQIKLLSRVSDYYKNGKYAEDNKTPDLKFSYKNIPFAIECKYRSGFINNSITWATDYQIKNYNNFEKQNATPVFVAIGVGGNPNAPQNIYLVPLYRLPKSFAMQNYIAEFKINNPKDFLENLTKR